MINVFLVRLSFATFLALFLLPVTVIATTLRYVPATIKGERILVRDDRQPALYTADYGDCLGGNSLINVTRFEAAYYKDNMTVAFHLGGTTQLSKDNIMMFLGVYAYGEPRFELTFNPCKANIWSACPLQAEVPIEAAGFIPVSPLDVAGIPDLALTIPDFEGEAILRIFSNSTQTEIGCFAAQITNGNTFDHHVEVGSALAAFTVLALLSSFATVAYFDTLPVTRSHYAHSCSVLVLFSVWHHIFYSGALAVDWPTVLIAFWNNYSWASGLVKLEWMQCAIGNFVGSPKSSLVTVTSVESNYNIHNIYKRLASRKAMSIEGLVEQGVLSLVARGSDNIIEREVAGDAETPFSFRGRLIKPELPLPGDHSGFAALLAKQNIPGANAFSTALIFLLITFAIMLLAVPSLGLLLSAMVRLKLLQGHRLSYFRAHLGGYLLLVVSRALFVSFFAMALLAILQFFFLASTGATALACIVLLAYLLTLGGTACYALVFRYKHSFRVSQPDRINIEYIKIFKLLPWYRLSRSSIVPRSEDKRYVGSFTWWTVTNFSDDKSCHNIENFTKRFGWLASRFRRTRWWFFTAWLLCEFIRACFLAGAASQPKVQVFGLLVVEVIAFTGLMGLRPFEGQRVNVVLVYCLGFSKVATTALSATFIADFKFARIPATVVGIVIIVMHGLLTVITLVAIVVGTVTTYFSLTRNHDTIKPKQWNHMRNRYLQHVEFRSHDIPRSRHSRPYVVHEMQTGPYFSVNEVKRLPKVEDEDSEFMHNIKTDPYAPQLSLPESESYGTIDIPRPRAASIQSHMSYSSLPRRARLHRASWSSQDFRTSTIRTPDLGSRPTSRILLRLNAQADGCESLHGQ